MSDDENIPTQEENNIVKEMVQAMLMLDHSKKPFKQADIMSHLSQKPRRKFIKEFLDKARNNLDSLGLELVELKDAPVKSFFVVNKQRPLQFMHKYATEEEVSTRTLLTLVLAYIFMKNGRVESGELLSHLRSLEIYSDEEVSHPYFGNVKKKVLHEFVDQLYLSTLVTSDAGTFDITWGPRAELEITKRSILEFVCHCGFGGKIKPQNLVYHYEKVLMEESQGNRSTSSVVDVIIE